MTEISKTLGLWTYKKQLFYVSVLFIKEFKSCLIFSNYVFVNESMGAHQLLRGQSNQKQITNKLWCNKVTN